MIMQESYNKGLNVLIHAIEDESNAWGKREMTVQKFETFLNDILKIDSDDIELVDIRQLPQYPIKKNGKIVQKPKIIVKLINIQDKSRIFSSAENFKTFNKRRSVYDENSPYIYVTEHLTSKLSRTKKITLA